MTLMNVLALATMLAAGSVVQAAAPVAPASNAAHLTATRDLLAAMQVDKMLNSVAGASRYANEAQRNAVYAKNRESAGRADLRAPDGAGCQTGVDRDGAGNDEVLQFAIRQEGNLRDI